MFDIAELVWPRAEHQPSEQPRNSVLAFGLAGDDLGERSIILDVTGRVITR
jgi:hypothetical protein